MTISSFTDEVYEGSFNFTGNAGASNYRTLGELIALIVCGSTGVLLVMFFNVLHLIALKTTKSLFTYNLRLCLRVLGVVDFIGGTVGYGKVILIAIDHTFYSDVTKCNVSTGVMFLFVGMSHMILMLITIDRYIAVTRPLRYHAILTMRRIKALVVVALIGGAVLGELPIIHWSFYGYCHPDQEHFVAIAKGSPVIVGIYMAVPIAIVILTTVLNVHVLFISRSHEYRADVQRRCTSEIKSRSEEEQSRDDGKVEESRRGARSTTDSFLQRGCFVKLNKGTVTISVIVGTSYLVWTPGFLLVMNTLGNISETVSFILYMMMISNHWLNPVILFIMNKRYRMSVIHLLQLRK